MADSRTHLRIRVTDDPPWGRVHRRVEVLDPDDNVLGDLASSVSEIRWRATARDLGIVSIDIAVERAQIDSIELPGHNAPKREC